MNKNVVNKIIRGTNGRLWVNDKLLANVKSFECKVKLDYEDIDENGNPIKQRRYTGASIEGTMVLHKVDSYVLKLMKDGIMSMDMPDINMVSKVADPSVTGSERVKLSNVTLDEVSLASFENGKVAEESVPFRAGGFDNTDDIDDFN
ncbi:phage tail tube protein [Acidaminococcus intestini]|uniref:phage tail tube protein n=1 Tax=Acidaminococcus intestini TaxID=187327 RepID=UPI0020648959|nr:phage tail tube protein [Acidaminococcus intestini]DAI76204.1 MAG TPA: tail tube protein [Caudoviricetes sp.]